jgi:hypothetical protein
MKKMIQLLLLSTCAGCGHALTDVDADTQTPVVEGYLTEGENSLTVKVYSMEVYLKDDYRLSTPVDGLHLTVSDRVLTETRPGTYALDLGVDTLREGQVFDLRFEYDGRTVEGSAAIPAPVRGLRVEPESLVITSTYYPWDLSDTTGVTVSWDDPAAAVGSYYQVYIESPDVSGVSLPSGVFGRRMMQPFRGNTYRTTARDFRSPGSHRIFVYRVCADYAALYERISSSDLANPSTSIRNAFGIFTALSVAEVRIAVYEE